VLLGRHEAAAALLAQVAARAPRRGRVAFFTRVALADLALERGDAAGALRAYCAWLAEHRALRSRTNEAYQVDGVVLALAGLGRYEEAVTVAAIGDALRAEFSIRPPREVLDLRAQALDPALRTLGAAAVEQARRLAGGFGLDQGLTWVAARADEATASA
jgi:hypothetical protein